MKKIFDNVSRITSKKDYEALTAHLENLIQEAIQSVHLATPDPNSEYRRETGRLSRLSGIYEAEYDLWLGEPLLVKTVKMEMAQREAAKLLGVPEHSFSRFLTGKRKISFEFAQKLYRTFNIDPKTILSYWDVL